MSLDPTSPSVLNQQEAVILVVGTAIGAIFVIATRLGKLTKRPRRERRPRRPRRQSVTIKISG